MNANYSLIVFPSGRLEDHYTIQVPASVCDCEDALFQYAARLGVSFVICPFAFGARRFYNPERVAESEKTSISALKVVLECGFALRVRLLDDSSYCCGCAFDAYTNCPQIAVCDCLNSLLNPGGLSCQFKSVC